MNNHNSIIFNKDGIAGFLIRSKKYGQHSVIIDTEDIDKIKTNTWYVSYIDNKPRYIRTSIKKNGKFIITSLHSFLTGYKMTDHINGNGFDNRKSNLRECNHFTNSYNSGKSKNNTSGYKGVSLVRGKYYASIRADGKDIHLGTYKTLDDAATAYNFGAYKYHGRFAKLNTI